MVYFNLQGDDGGPLVYEGDSTLLVGVSSWGEASCSPTFPTVFVRISYFRDWIVGQ